MNLRYEYVPLGDFMHFNHEIYGYNNYISGIWHMYFVDKSMLVNHNIYEFLWDLRIEKVIIRCW